MLESTIKQGVFKEELKNRFLCLVTIDGEDTLCYIPSSCRLSNFVELPGKQVLLQPVKSPNSRTKYSVYALCVRNSQVLLNLSKANRAVEHSIKSRRFSALGKRAHVRKEYTVGGYKCDLFIEDTNTIVEIKSILSFGSEARFPSMHSQRAIDQLMKLSQMLDEGYKVCYVFVSLNPKVRQVLLNPENMDYQVYFRQCINKGMMVKGVSIKLVDGEPIIHSSIDVITDNTQRSDPTAD